MENKVKIGASLACANFGHLEKDIREMEQAGVDYIHFDIMDGHFVPNFALNFDILKLVRGLTSLPIDVHLMVDNPELYIPVLAKEGCNILSFHYEVVYHTQRELTSIRRLGLKSSIALNPSTPLNVLDYIFTDLDVILIMTVNPGFAGQKLIPATIKKIKKLRKMLDEKGVPAEIQVDGNVSFENIPMLVNAGATMLVGGTSSVFKKGMSISDAVLKMRSVIPG
ncbi:MAG: ribulose-phosphate 3-epimerase [Anaerolineaceae bacterium]|nr:ribulose-phosphate 3-epimerase [Anaerolineaceae bacterium]